MTTQTIQTTHPSFLINNLLNVVGGVSVGAGSAAASAIFPGLIGINPAISAIFMTTFSITRDLSQNFSNYCLEKFRCDKNKHQFIHLVCDLASLSGSVYLALKVSAVSASAFQLISLMVLGFLFSIPISIIAGVTVAILQETFTNNANNNSPIHA